MAASVSSDNSATLFEEAPQIDESLLIAFLEESQILEETEDERLGCVIRSLQEEIESRADSEEPNYDDQYSYESCHDLVTGGFMEEDEEGQEYCSNQASMSRHVDDINPFDWVDMDVGHCQEMGGWLLDMGVAQFAEVSDYYGDQGYSGDDEVLMEQDYMIPLWQDSYDYISSM